MGALAPISQWLPQDDLLLKNAVEAGASLEALAKGAVQFSQRFTVQELQDRWYSLLYDPVISAEASILMIEFEHSASIPKSNKEAKSTPEKRKADSVRQCYYSMRKRICSEPFDPTGISFLDGPGFSIARKFDEHLSSDCIFGDEEVSDLFGIQESKFSIMPHTFPEVRAPGAGSSSDGISTSAFCTGLYDNDEFKSLCPSSAPLNNCPSLADNTPLTVDQDIVKEFAQSTELRSCNLFQTMNLDIEDSCIFEEINDNEGNVHSGFESEVYISPPSDSGTSLPNFHDSSPIPQMPNWSAVEDLAPSTLANIIGETADHAQNNIVTLDDFDANGPNILGYSSVDPKPELKGQIPFVVMNDPVPNADEYFVELSNSLLNFTTDDDLIFGDGDEKDMIEKSYIENLSSLLLDSPDEGHAPDLGISEVAVDPHFCLTNSPSAAHPGESGEQAQYHYDDQPLVLSVEARKLSSALAVNPSFPELRNGVIFCTLNTEDPEIPNNDDVFLPICLPSTSSSAITHTKYDESYYPMLSSAEEFSYAQKATDRTLTSSEQSNYSQLHFQSHSTRSSYPTEPLQNDAQHVTLKNATTCEGPVLVNSAPSCDKNLVHGSEKQLLAKVEQPKTFLNHNTYASHLEKQAQSSDPHFVFQNNAAGGKQDIDSTSNFQNREETAAEEITIPVVSDQEELPCESDDDVPYFSDVEAMILDMDLSPDDQNLNCNPGVLKYQQEDARRIIIRLEQAANASSQRMLFERRAFAVLYGHLSKHFIKKTEVLIGRSTKDVKVDIDLGMECDSNKISRRQATIKMDTSGSFHLTNHGKFSIFVNGKEVIPRENVDLVSGCLIEVRGLPFIFETYRKPSPGNSGNDSQSWEEKHKC